MPQVPRTSLIGSWLLHTSIFVQRRKSPPGTSLYCTLHSQDKAQSDSTLKCLFKNQYHFCTIFSATLPSAQLNILEITLIRLKLSCCKLLGEITCSYKHSCVFPFQKYTFLSFLKEHNNTSLEQISSDIQQNLTLIIFLCK